MMGLVIFQISTMLAVGLLLLTGLVLAAISYSAQSGQELDRWWFLPAFVLLAGTALFTVRNYVYPDRSIFDNSKYHVLEHLGFEADSSIALVQARYPEASLWDSKSTDSATVLLTRKGEQTQIDIDHFHEPFYLGAPHHGFVLQNNLIDADLTTGLMIRRDKDLKLELKMISGPRADTVFYLSRTQEADKFDTSHFYQPIAKGYPLMEILLETPHIHLSEETKAMLQGALLVRDVMGMEDTLGTISSRPNTSPLRLFPGKDFWLSGDISVNGRDLPGPGRPFHIQADKNVLFFAGMGMSATPVLKIAPALDKKIRLTYVLPRMQSLRQNDTGNMLFLTSSTDEVGYQQLKAGYLFDIFTIGNNLNHISATLYYRTGSSKEAMYCRVNDLHATTQEREIFPADTIISLKSLNRINRLSWLMKIHNLRETNSLRITHIERFILIFLVCVVIRLIVDNRMIAIPFAWRRPFPPIGHAVRIPLVELAVYIVLFCLTVLRLILAWRMSTFVPIEDIDAARFFKMRDGHAIYSWTTGFVIGFFLLIIIRRLWCNTSDLTRLLSRKLNGPRQKMMAFRRRIPRLPADKDLSAQGRLLLYFIAVIIALVLLSKILSGTFARLLNIPLPVLAYFIVDYLILKEGVSLPARTPRILGAVFKYIYSHYARILLWMITFLYLAYQDSGFSIIFFLYGIVHHIFSQFFFPAETGNRKLWAGCLYILLITALFCGFLYWESDMIISAFRNTFLWVAVMAGGLIVIGALTMTNPYFEARRWRNGLGIACFAMALLLVLGSGKLSDKLNRDKNYIKYRAEIQQPGASIENMIGGKAFRSVDMSYMLRSALNQWIINLYNDDPPAQYFEIRPHFNQGSSFTTQTTDLVVTRYLLAEHPGTVIILLMLFFLSLPVIYSLSLNLKDPPINYSILGIFILLYAVAFFVYLSATNRIVFFGQDFPFLSLTSRIAVLFPLLIFCVAIFNSWRPTVAGVYYGDFERRQKLLFLTSVLVITLACVCFIPSSNRHKNDTHFDISQLIDKTASKIERLNDEFASFQGRNPVSLQHLEIDSLFNLFIADSMQYPRLLDILQQKEGPFLASLVARFREPFTNKWDPNELMHIRKRAGIYSLAVNRKYYFIPSFKEGDRQWQGNLLAAATAYRLGFVNLNRHIFSPTVADGANILHSPDLVANREVPELGRYRSQLNNIDLMKLDTGWTPDGTALYLIKADSGDKSENRAGFRISNDTMAINGMSKYAAIRLQPGDLLELTVHQPGGRNSLIKWTVVEERDKYLARNLWLNGSQTLFYPMGEKFIWSYNFANLVRNAWGDSAHLSYKKRDLRVSIDYDLTKKIYEIIDAENAVKQDLDSMTRARLMAFYQLDPIDKRRKENPTGIYWTDRGLDINWKKGYHGLALKDAIARINKSYPAIDKSDEDAGLNKLVAEQMEKKFDYSAVVLDGYGRIRAISDYSRHARTNPNRVKDFSRFLSDLYKEGSNASERDFFGNRALQTIYPGPGSSFKPIAFSAVTSKLNLGWEGLEVEAAGAEKALAKYRRHGKDEMGFAFYGGKSFREDIVPGLRPYYWQVEGYAKGLTAKTYLVASNNLFHSVVMMLGSQDAGVLRLIKNKKYEVLFKDITGSPYRDSLTFPVIRYQGRALAFDPDKWLTDHYYFNNKNSVLASGLQENFRMPQARSGMSDTGYFNAMGVDTVFGPLFHAGFSSNFLWSYPAQSSFIQVDRAIHPDIWNGLIQPSLGVFPIKVTPLNMATMGMRLATLNRYEYLTTLAPEPLSRPYEPFHLDRDWDTTAFLRFYQECILDQLQNVVENGTALLLKPSLARYKKMHYYFYAKTGTATVNEENDERDKHLLLIISKENLHDAHVPLTWERLKNLHYYVIYMSYLDIGIKDIVDKTQPERDKQFSAYIFRNYGKVIAAVMDSELFTKYMEDGK